MLEECKNNNGAFRKNIIWSWGIEIRAMLIIKMMKIVITKAAMHRKLIVVSVGLSSGTRLATKKRVKTRQYKQRLHYQTKHFQNLLSFFSKHHFLAARL